MTHINDIVKLTDSILIVPAPAGYLIMKAPTSDDHEPEMFAALSSAGDLLLFLIDLYGADLPPNNESIETLSELTYDSLYDVGRVDTRERKALTEPLSPGPEKLPAKIRDDRSNGGAIVVASPVRVPVGMKQERTNAPTRYLGVHVKPSKTKGDRYIATLTENGKTKRLHGTHDSGELAAAARAEYLGDHEDATRLRKLHEQNTQEPVVTVSPEEPTHDAAGRRIALKGTSNSVLQENTQTVEETKSEPLEPKVAAVVKTMLDMPPITHKPTIEEVGKNNIEKAKTQGVALARGPLGFMCDDCGETFEKCPQECPKCGSGTMEQLD